MADDDVARETRELLARISGDLHDHAVQHNVAALMLLEGLERELSPVAAEAAAQMRLSLLAMRRVISDIDAVHDGHDTRSELDAGDDRADTSFQKAPYGGSGSHHQSTIPGA